MATTTPPTNPRNTYSKEEQERNDALRAQYTRMVDYNARHFQRGGSR